MRSDTYVEGFETLLKVKNGFRNGGRPGKKERRENERTEGRLAGRRGRRRPETTAEFSLRTQPRHVKNDPSP